MQVLGFILEITKAARVAELEFYSDYLLRMYENKRNTFYIPFLKNKKESKQERKKEIENDSPCVCVVCFTFSSPLEPVLSFTICRF